MFGLPSFIGDEIANAVRELNGRPNYRTAFLPENRPMMDDWAA